MICCYAWLDYIYTPLPLHSVYRCDEPCVCVCSILAEWMHNSIQQHKVIIYHQYVVFFSWGKKKKEIKIIYIAAMNADWWVLSSSSLAQSIFSPPIRSPSLLHPSSKHTFLFFSSFITIWITTTTTTTTIPLSLSSISLSLSLSRDTIVDQIIDNPSFLSNTHYIHISCYPNSNIYSLRQNTISYFFFLSWFFFFFYFIIPYI